MNSEIGEMLMLWTVRCSVACYVVALWQWLFAERFPDAQYRRFWTAAWLLCVVHVICAFHFRHHWDHDVAIQHTANMTEGVVGIHWGGGLYINYVFLVCWGTSVAGTWRQTPAVRRITQQLTGGMHAFVAFMMINATVVFGPAWWWIPMALVLTVITWNYKRRRSATVQN